MAVDGLQKTGIPAFCEGNESVDSPLQFFPPLRRFRTGNPPDKPTAPTALGLGVVDEVGREDFVDLAASAAGAFVPLDIGSQEFVDCLERLATANDLHRLRLSFFAKVGKFKSPFHQAANFPKRQKANKVNSALDMR
jgi:hypothetical protein